MKRSALILCLLLLLPAAVHARQQKAVLVTGASSGIGRAITERLAASGFYVYAGARSQADLNALDSIPNVQSIRLDVTVDADIAAAVQVVTRGGRGLHGVVNNAGVVVVAPLVEMEEKELDYILDINLKGPFRITRAFAPMLIESRGRVVNISSLNGTVANAMIGAYSITKHGIEAYSDALAAELGRFGVRVSIIQPGNFGTDIGRNLMARADTSRLQGSRFATQWRATLNGLGNFASNPAPAPVADAVFDALSAETPHARYLVVPAANQGAIVMQKLFEEMMQMNETSAFPMDRDAMIRMLDAALARSRSVAR